MKEGYGGVPVPPVDPADFRKPTNLSLEIGEKSPRMSMYNPHISHQTCKPTIGGEVRLRERDNLSREAVAGLGTVYIESKKREG